LYFLTINMLTLFEKGFYKHLDLIEYFFGSKIKRQLLKIMEQK